MPTAAEMPRWLVETRSAWKLPRKVTVSEWADENMVLDGSSPEPGRWRTSRTPYLRGPMDALTDQSVRSIVLMGPTQSGKTAAPLNMLGYIIDQDPGPTLWVAPDEKAARKFSRTRIHPMLKGCPALRRRLSKNEDDVTRSEIYLDRMFLFMAWSNSASALSSVPIKNIIFDEVDKYPAFTGREADPISLGSERTRNFWNHKKIYCSTPTTKAGYIWNLYQKTDRCQYYVPCPHCGKYQNLIFGRVKVPADNHNPQDIIVNRLAYYECIRCKGKINDNMKIRMLDKGVWVPKACTIDDSGRIRGKVPHPINKGFWWNALYSPWRTFSDVAAEFFASKDDPSKLMNFVNSWLAEPWEEKSKETEIDHIKRRCGDYSHGKVPEEAKILLGSCDVQKDYFRIAVRAWGFDQRSWLIHACRAETWGDVKRILIDMRFPFINGKKQPIPVRMSAIDTGSKTDEVYEFCRRYQDRARAIKGDSRVTGIPFQVSRIDRYPGTGAVIDEGLQLWRIDTDFFKDKLHRYIHAENSRWHIYKNVQKEYLQEMCAEQKIIKRDRKTKRAREVWELKHSGGQNHYWDCEVYIMALAEMLRIPELRDIYQAQEKEAAPPEDDESRRYMDWSGGRLDEWWG